MTTRRMIGIMTVLCLLAANVIAQDKSEEETPPIGAPGQMNEIAFLEGVWSVDMEWQDDKDPDAWTKEKAVCTYKAILEGCAMECRFQGTMMGMPFEGYMLQSYDRDKKQWQALWLDNFGGKMSFYTGNKRGEKMVFTGKEMWQGQEYLSRMSTFNHTPKSFDWTMESSFDGGKTWTVTGKAKYTKRM